MYFCMYLIEFSSHIHTICRIYAINALCRIVLEFVFMESFERHGISCTRRNIWRHEIAIERRIKHVIGPDILDQKVTDSFASRIRHALYLNKNHLENILYWTILIKYNCLFKIIFSTTNYLSNIIKVWRSSKSRTHWISKFKYRWSLSESAEISLCSLPTRWNSFYCTLSIKKISQIKMYAKFLIIVSVKTKIAMLFSVKFANWKQLKQSKLAKLWLFKNEVFYWPSSIEFNIFYN